MPSEQAIASHKFCASQPSNSIQPLGGILFYLGRSSFLHREDMCELGQENSGNGNFMFQHGVAGKNS
jgi:hypothetical protein